MRPSRQWLRRAVAILSMVCALVLCAAASDDSVESLKNFDLPSAPSPWFKELDFRTAMGYKDNVSLASVAPVGSGYLSTGIEAFASRLPIDGAGLDFFLLFDDLHYFRSAPVDIERLGFAQMTARRELSEFWQASVGLEYLYQDQVLDVSTTEAFLNTVQVEGQSVTLRPGMRIQLHPRFYLSADLDVNRQFFRAPLDNYWEGGTRVGLGWTYGHRSELTATYESNQRSYDHYEQLDSAGFAVPGTTRAFGQQEIKLALRHYYDKNRHWRSALKFGFRSNQDNGSGYFDYTRIGVSHQLMYRATGWEARAEMGYSNYKYDVQRAHGPGSPRRQRDDWNVTLRVEKELARFVKAFAQYEYEKTTSNEEFFAYTVNVVSGGVIWIF